MSRQDRPRLPEHPPAGMVEEIVRRATKVDALANVAAVAIIAVMVVVVFWRIAT